MWNLKNKANKPTKEKQTHRYREQMGGYQMEGGLEGHEIGEEDCITNLQS